jgi:phospholipid-binding lipoprotein MlaA
MLAWRVMLRMVACGYVFASLAATADTGSKAAYPPGSKVYAEPLPDPLEGFNRSMHVFNKTLLQYVLYPVGTGVDFLLPDPLQRGLRNAGHNTLYPLRLLNNCLQGKWPQAWGETTRFAVNSSVGILGFRDQATQWNMPSYDEDFGQTFGHYNLGPGFYLNLPFLGPSSGRDAVGLVLDYPFDLLRWIFSGGTSMAVDASLRLNALSLEVAAIQQFFAAQEDGYSMLRAQYTLLRELQVRDYHLPTEFADHDPDQSLGYVMLRPIRKDYALRGRTRRLQILGAVEKLSYTSWHCPHDRGVLLILPGIGGHRLSTGVAALAELFVADGWSVIALSSSFTPDYFLGAASAGYLPGNMRADARVLSEVLRVVLADYRRHHPGSAPTQAVLGFSLGALNTLFLAEREASEQEDALSFAQYLAINPPVDPLYALRRVDEFFAIPATWPAAEREARIYALFQRLGAAMESIRRASAGPTAVPPAPPPMTRDESCFLIGMNMRLALMEMLIASQRVDNLGVLRQDPTRRNSALEAEALGTSYDDYVKHYLLPYLTRQNPNLLLPSLEEMARGLSLRSLDVRLREFDKLVVFQNSNDFLLGAEDAAWYGEFLGDRAQLFPAGSHLGNMARPDYQQAMKEVINRAGQARP